MLLQWSINYLLTTKRYYRYRLWWKPVLFNFYWNTSWDKFTTQPFKFMILFVGSLHTDQYDSRYVFFFWCTDSFFFVSCINSIAPVANSAQISLVLVQSSARIYTCIADIAVFCRYLAIYAQMNSGLFGDPFITSITLSVLSSSLYHHRRWSSNMVASSVSLSFHRPFDSNLRGRRALR